MKRDKRTIRAALAALGMLCGVLALPAAHAGSVTVNNTLTCDNAPTITMTPSGDLTVTCNAVSAGPPTVAPVCTVSASPATITVGGTATLTASCSGSPTSYSWVPSAFNATGGPALSSTTIANPTVTFPATATPATYSYLVTATNSVAPSAQASGSVVVNAASTGGGGGGSGGCPTSADAAYSSNGQWFSFNLPKNGTYSFKLPLTVARRTAELSTANYGGSTPEGLMAQLVIAPCPGQFGDAGQPAVPAECKSWGSVRGGSTQLNGWGSATPLAGGCTMTPGVQYYVNVRNVLRDLTTSSCILTSCLQILQYNENSF